MNWDAIGVIAESAGALAVVVTLAFLTIETRRNRITGESTSLDSMASGWNGIIVHIMTDPELCEIWTKGFANPDNLNEGQLTRFMLMGQALVNHFATIKKHYDSGSLPEPEWKVHSAGTAHVLCSPGGHWLRKNVGVTPDVEELFQSFDDNLSRESFMTVPG